jgi:tRNA threonylcarbamoyladenosine biosynthesis protein TsaE
MTLQYKLEEINEIAQKILAFLPKKIILFEGEMGVGKTTLIKSIAQQLGVKNPTSSPTFSLVNEYETEFDTIYHFDFYRLKATSEAYDMGADDYFYSGNWCFIEWSEKIKDLLPAEYSVIKIEQLENNDRKLVIENN